MAESGIRSSNFSMKNQSMVLTSAGAGLQRVMQVENKPFKRLLTDEWCKAKTVLDYGPIMKSVTMLATHLNIVT